MDKTNNEENFVIDIEMQARMVNEHWHTLVKKNKWKFKSDDAEYACKALFIAGYHCAWNDACEISTKACAMDELLAKQN